MRELWQRLRHWRSRERGLDEEIRFHIDQQTAKNLAAGMTPEDARRHAYLKFGGVEYLKEQTRDEVPPGAARRLPARCALRHPHPPSRPRVRRRRHPDARARDWRRHRRLQRRRRRPVATAALSEARTHRAAVSSRRQRPPSAEHIGAELRGLEVRHAELQRDGGDVVGPDSCRHGRRGDHDATAPACRANSST